MFVLITGEREVISGATTVQAFATHKEAHDAMMCDARARAWDAGMAEDELDMYIGHIDDYSGFILDVVGWQIREIPGLFLSEDDMRLVTSYLTSFGVGQTNFEASETALDVCNLLKGYVEA